MKIFRTFAALWRFRKFYHHKAHCQGLFCIRKLKKVVRLIVNDRRRKRRRPRGTAKFISINAAQTGLVTRGR